jgi:hypothetical protein
MDRPVGVVGAFAFAIALASAATTVQAQGEEPAQEAVQAGEGEAPAEENARRPAPAQDEARSAPPEGELSGERPRQSRNWYVGPWFRLLIVPSFALDIFLDHSPTIVTPGFGLSATMRRKSVSFAFGLGYTSYHFEDPFLAKGDPVLDTEWVDSSLSLVHATSSILWPIKLSKAFTFEYGIGADVGIVLGEMRRTEAYGLTRGRWAPCANPGNPDPNFCESSSVPYDESGGHYDEEEKRIPPVAILPMVPHLALRWRPEKHWAVKLEGAYGILQLWAGLSIAFAPEQ